MGYYCKTCTRIVEEDDSRQCAACRAKDSTDIPALVDEARAAEKVFRNAPAKSAAYSAAKACLITAAPVLAEEVERLRKLLSMIHRIADANNVSDEAIGGTAFKTIMKLTKEGTA